MANLQGEIKRGVLRSLFRKTQDSSTALFDALAAFQDSGFTGIKSGKLVIASAGAGHSVTFATPQSWQQFTQEQVFSLSEELCQVYDDARVALSAQGNATPDDQTIFNTMMADDRLSTITTVQSDFSLLRWPGRS